MDLLDKDLDLATKLAVYMVIRKIKYKDFAKLIKKYPGEVSNYTRGIVKRPEYSTALLIQKHTDGYITLKDCGYE